MHSTRQTIVETLTLSGRLTVNQLADKIGVKAVTIRHHLAALQAEGIVAVEEKRQPIGRPMHLYYLTDKAQSFFPQRYHVLADRLLDQIKQQFPPATVQSLVTSLADSLAAKLKQEFEQLPFEERMTRLVEVLAEEGFVACWRHTPHGLELIEYRCPYYHVGQRHPEICQIDEALIRAALDAAVQRKACLLTGDANCTLVVRCDSLPSATAGGLVQG